MIDVTERVGGSASAKISVRDRVLRRVQLLRDWDAKGVPENYIGRMPSSLRAVARWNDPGLGIVPIASPNDFSMNHRSWGTSVAEIDSLLKCLRNRYRKQGGSKEAAHRASPHPNVKTVLRQLEDAVSRWHAEREDALNQRERLKGAEARIARMSFELREKDALIAELRKRLVALETLRSIR